MNTFAVFLCLLVACSNESGPEPIRLNAPDFVSGFPNLDEKLAEGALTFDLTHVDKVTFHIDDTHRWFKPSDTLIRPLRVLVHDGKIAVVQSTRVHFYDDDGNHPKMIGQHGKGPGEFDVITSVGLNGDKLVIYDSNMRRFTTIGSEYESQNVARFAPANERKRSILFTGLNEYVLESRRLDSTRLGVTDITSEEVLTPIPFPMPVPYG